MQMPCLVATACKLQDRILEKAAEIQISSNSAAVTACSFRLASNLDFFLFHQTIKWRECYCLTESADVYTTLQHMHNISYYYRKGGGNMFLILASQASQEKVKVLNEHQKLFTGALIHSNSLWAASYCSWLADHQSEQESISISGQSIC